MTTTVRVRPRFMVCWQGKVYRAGEVVEVSDDAASGWRDWGSVEHVEADTAEAALRARKGGT